MRRGNPIVALCGWLAAAALAEPGIPSLAGTPLGELLDRLDRAREDVRTLRAGFDETRDSDLFADPVRASGTLLVAHPDRVLWVFESPEKRYFLLEGRTMTAWYPDRRIAERQDVRRHGQRLRRMVGFGESSSDLLRSNQVSLLPESTLAGTAELLLVPRNRRIREYVSEIRLWIDEASALPRQVRYREPSGDEVTIRLDRIEVNPTLPPEAFTVPIPPGVEIREAVSGLGPLEGE